MNAIPLTEWISGALTQVGHRTDGSFPPSIDGHVALATDSKKSHAILSNNFLFSALRVASSLASQVSQAESSQTGSNRSDNGASASSSLDVCQLPATGNKWMDQVLVFLRPSSDSNAGQIVLPSFSRGSIQNEDFSRHPQNFVNPFSSNNFGGVEEKKVNYGTLERTTLPCLDVERAEIFPLSFSHGNTGKVGKLEDSIGHLYSLGLVFYELFTGGEKPEFGSENGIILEPDEFSTPLSVDEDAPIDLASALHIMEALNDDGVDNEQQGNPIESNQNGLKKPRQSHIHSTFQTRDNIQSVCFEALTSQGLPTSLCRLIANMIDCANGDLRGDESYTRMSDVFADLQLMLDKPDKFLYDQDFGNLALNGLPLDELSFGREDELSSLLSAYQKSVEGETEIAFITGPSGTGKSFLAHRFSQIVRMNGGKFLSGKFNQQKDATPFSAISAAFNEYCDVVFEAEGRIERIAIRTQLRESFGEEIFHLMKVIPSLCKLVECTSSSSIDVSAHGCVNAQQRLQYLLCEFVRAISTVASVPLVLFLDDLHWADAASIAVMNNLVLNHGAANRRRNIFFLFSCRDDEMAMDHPAKNMISGFHSFGVSVKTINLSCMKKEVVNLMVSDLLCLPPRLTRSLSEIVYHKTKGNSLFFSKLMVSLCRDGVLDIDLARRRWVWDEEVIQTRKLPDDVASFLSGMISCQPKNVQSALSVLACFGAATASLVKTLENEIGLPLVGPLDVAVSEGFLDMVNGAYSFSHENVLQSSYNLIDPSLRQSKHFEYGLALSAGALEARGGPFLFTAVGQLNRGGPSAVNGADQGEMVARLNYLCGCEAAEMSDISTSFYFFQKGISFLPQDHWNRNYDISLQLFEGALKYALAIANVESLNHLSIQILENARSLDDKLNTIYVAVCSLAQTSRHSEAVEKCILILEQLGEHLPPSFEQSDFELQMNKTRSLISGLSGDDLLRHKRMKDHSKIMSMKFLSKLAELFTLMRSGLYTIAILKMVQMSIVHGMSPISPVGFAGYGSFLSKQGNVAEGCRFARISKDLLDSIGSNEVAGLVYLMTTMMLAAVEPMQAAKEYYTQGYNMAMSVGDIDKALLIKTHSVQLELLVGTKLQVVQEKVADGCILMRRNNNQTCLANIAPTMVSVSKLIGIDTTHSTSQNEVLEIVKKIPHHAALFGFSCMYFNFLLRNYDETKTYAEKYLSSKMEWTFVSVFNLSNDYICGLVSFWLYRRTKEQIWAQRGNQSLKAMKAWAKSSHWNAQSKAFILEAEECFCNNVIATAELLYEKGILCAKQQHFVNEEAISHELAGHFCLEIGKENKSFHHFTKAREAYQEWGALAKVVSLNEYLQKVFNQSQEK